MSKQIDLGLIITHVKHAISDIISERLIVKITALRAKKKNDLRFNDSFNNEFFSGNCRCINIHWNVRSFFSMFKEYRRVVKGLI